MANCAFTICAVNYLSKALLLADSFEQHNPGDQFFIFLVERKFILPELKLPKNTQIRWIEDLDYPNLNKIAFKFDIIEFSTCVKPFIMCNLLKQFERCLYLDPDVKVYSSLKPLFDELQVAPIILTPHTTTPICDGNKPGDIEFLKFGAFNLGFVGVNNSKIGISFLNWWNERLIEFGYYEPQNGLAVDQKWIDLAPCYFEGVKIIRDPGCNLAFWNLHERILLQNENFWWVNRQHRLKFVHFSSFDQNKPENIADKQSRFLPNSRQDFVQLAKEYADELKKRDTGLNLQGYSFDTFEDGKPVSQVLRRLYSIESKLQLEANPFIKGSNTYNYAKKNSLIPKAHFKRENFKDLVRYNFAQKIILLVFRMTLKILGPHKYFNLMRYLAHISSIRNQIGMLKN